MSAGVRPAPGRAEFSLFVADAHRGRGIGTLLLEHLAARARRPQPGPGRPGRSGRGGRQAAARAGRRRAGSPAARRSRPDGATMSTRKALAFAADQASARGVPLRVIRAWKPVAGPWRRRRW
ncbi:GNAT family N-acetyltransferase [Paractinoplanes globisporus]|uniref:GNAT family N-acetyltransferase n=1 Tax=Paractinoplanes globisporus TaxID=113565 RepID=A0ABW6WBD5_9ACTN|nr:GNAT family N-acetyltransferase [Actinoplanes globisporus]